MRLSEWREAIGRSVEDVADELGKTRQSVYRYEKPLADGGRLPDAETLDAIVDMTAGAVTPNDFFAPALFWRLDPPSLLPGEVIAWRPDRRRV